MKMVKSIIDKSEAFFLELPETWTCDRMKDIASLRNDKTAETSSKDDYLELEDLDSGTGKLLSKRNTLDVESSVTLFKKGDVLFGKLRPYLEKYYLADFDGKCTGEILAFKPDRVEGHFLRYCIASTWFTEKSNALAYGTKMPRVSWAKQLALFNIPLPPRNEQHMIAAYLDKTCAAIDMAIEAKQRQLELLDALRKSIIHKAVTRGLDDSVELKDSGVGWIGQIPRHWKTDRLRDVTTKIGSGITPEGGGTVYVDDGIPLFRSQNIYFDGLHLDDIVCITEEQHRSMSSTHVQPYDVLLNITGASLGRCHYVPDGFGEANVNQHVCIIRPTQKLNFKFLFYFITSDAGQSQILSGFRGASRQGLNFREIKAFVLTLPPDKEQRDICKYLDSEIIKFKKLKDNIESQIKTLEQYRKSLIHECVTGKRRITGDDLKDQHG
ncbi:Type-1 restriction enzyme EcoKI specificity protein [Candidatus Brocadiaceae bacterium]|nr:Type-1 restriction enzyme EcoKI specificity protein [Candidatus Brocadiaceae bacterium]